MSCRLLSRHSVPTSWEFSLEQVGNSHWNKLAFHGISPTYQVTYLLISAPWTHESTSLDVNKANGKLTSNAKGIFCHNVRCFATNKSCSNRCHLQECFKCSSLLACKAARVQLSVCFPICLSRIHLAASLYLCPADSVQDILFQQAGNSHWNKLGILTGTSWHFMAFLRHIK